VNDPLTEVPFRLRIQHRAGGRCVVVASGEVDVHAAPELDRNIREYEGGDVTLVVVDLTEATLLDSTALGVLVAARARLDRRAIPLRLVCKNRLILRLLSITGLERVFDVYESSSVALDGQAPSGRRVRGGSAPDEAPSAPGAESES
jgi:anti-sigma B factor antagonist